MRTGALKRDLNPVHTTVAVLATTLPGSPISNSSAFSLDTPIPQNSRAVTELQNLWFETLTTVQQCRYETSVSKTGLAVCDVDSSVGCLEGWGGGHRGLNRVSHTSSPGKPTVYDGWMNKSGFAHYLGTLL